MGKIRTATKNFLCEKCNEIIKEGEEYYDWWNITKDSHYYHKRFHKNCTSFCGTNFNHKKSSKSIFDRIQNLIEIEGCLIAVNYLKNEKCYICGIHYDEVGRKSFLCETWGDKVPYYESEDNVKKNYIDYNGNHF